MIELALAALAAIAAIESRNPEKRIEFAIDDYKKGKISGKQAQDIITSINDAMVESQPLDTPSIPSDVKELFESGKLDGHGIRQLATDKKISYQQYQQLDYWYNYGGDSWSLKRK